VWCTLIRHGVVGCLGAGASARGSIQNFNFGILASCIPLYSCHSHDGGRRFARFFFHPFGAPMELEGSHVMEDRCKGDECTREGDDSMGWESRGGPMFSSLSSVIASAYIAYKCIYKSEEVVPCFLHGVVRILITARQIVEQFVD